MVGLCFWRERGAVYCWVRLSICNVSFSFGRSTTALSWHARLEDFSALSAHNEGDLSSPSSIL